MNIPEVIQSLFSDRDQDVMAIHDRAEGHIKAWKVERLKQAAGDVVPVEMALTNFRPELRMWFGDAAGTVKLAQIIPHLQRIQSADVTVPIIVFDGNRIVDGAHRFVRALLDGRTSIPCRVIVFPPAPDLIIPITADGEKIRAN